MSDLVGNAEDQFSHNETHYMIYLIARILLDLRIVPMGRHFACWVIIGPLPKETFPNRLV